MSVIIINKEGKRLNCRDVLSYAPMCIPTLSGQPNAICITMRGQADKEWIQDLEPQQMPAVLEMLDKAVGMNVPELYEYDARAYMIKQ